MLNARHHISAEESEFQHFLQNYDHKIFSHISQKIQSREDAKDVVQNVLVHLWSYRHLMYDTSWEQIVFKTCRQKTAEYYRKNKYYLHTDRLNETFNEAPDDLYQLEQREELLSALEANINLIIPPIRQSIFKMNKLQGITQGQIAVQLQISKRTVEDHISKAMAFLKNLRRNS